MRDLVTLALIAVLLLLSTEQNAHAYLDPGSGSMLLQLVLGGVAGLAVAAKLAWKRLWARRAPETDGSDHRVDSIDADGSGR